MARLTLASQQLSGTRTRLYESLFSKLTAAGATLLPLIAADFN